MEKLNVPVTAFLDDLVLGLQVNQDNLEAIRICAEIFLKYGLTLNERKCESTRDKNIVYCGFEFSKDREVRIPLAPKLI